MGLVQVLILNWNSIGKSNLDQLFTNEIISKTLEFVGGAVNRYKNIDLSKL